MNNTKQKQLFYVPRMLHIIAFFLMMCFIAVNKQGFALFIGKMASETRTGIFFV
jgi:hypothetical protein